MDRKISELDQVLNLDEQAEFPLSQDNGGTPTTFKAKLTQLAAKIAEAITFSNLITNDKHIIGAINEAAQGSGASMKFEDLSDVDINNLQDGQFSKYDSTSEKWKNTTIQESDVADLVSDLADKADKTDLVYEKTASGSIATFTDGGDDIPVSEYECEIVAQQANGTPTPVSPLPISGFSQADIAVKGKNFFDIESWLDANSIAYTKTGDSITFTPASSLYTNPYVFSDSDINISASVTSFIYNGSNLRLEFLNKNDESQTVITSGNLVRTNFNACKVRLNWSSMGTSVTVEKPMINLGITAQAYEPYTGNLYTVAFGQTIYGGRLIYKNGQWAIKATHNIVDLGSLDWGDLDGNGLHSSTDISDMIDGWYAQDLSDYLCEIFTPKSQNVGWSSMVNGEYGINNKYLRVKWTDISSGADFKTFVTGKYLVYDLATPVIIPITSSTRVKTLSGNNNIFSNTGDNSVKYFTENADNLAELIKASESESTGDYHEYSTDEQVIGTWIDGNTLYEKTVVVTNKTSQPSDWAEVVTLSDVDKVAHVEGWFTISTMDYFEGYYVRFMFDHSTNKLKYYCEDMANTNGDITVIIRYTKSTSNTRSLNLSKGVEENPIEEKTEEIKTEEVKEEEKNAEQNER